MTSQTPSKAESGLKFLLEMPLQAHSLARLSARELAIYKRARLLLSLGEGAQSLLRANVPLTGLGIYEALLAQSWMVRFDTPEEMVRLAETATEVAQSLPACGYGTKRISDFQARAWGELANAYRVMDRLRSSQQAFGRAYALMNSGTGDPYLKARLFDLEASLLGKWREFPLALSRLASLSNIYRELGEHHLAGRAFIVRALYTYYSGKPEEAILLNQEGINLIDQRQDSALFMQALHNHLVFLVELRLFEPARRVLFENRQHLIYEDRASALRLRWVEGRISYGLGNLVSAELAFQDAKKGLAKLNLIFAPAIVCLDLAMVYRSQNRTDEALKEIVSAREIFLSLEIYRDYLGSVIFLEESFRRGEETVELIEATVAHLQRKWLQVRPRQMQ